MTQLEKERFIGLEWLRFLFGCYVMIYHTAHHYPQFKAVFGLSGLTNIGFFATNAFFALSGFLLAHLYVRGRGLREPASNFWRKRLFNLYPIHIVALLSFMLVVTLMNGWQYRPKAPVRQSDLWFMTPMKCWARPTRNCYAITWIMSSWRSTACCSS
ncbi:MAG: acyltransferase family protein [Sodalis sp. (in: enterobacteria)]|uniref:acyltransferase family protein n=1 Tax=Sodalis sp. (in: enterobacteria) TaxID=1898979 RepID=UPI003F3BA8FC